MSARDRRIAERVTVCRAHLSGTQATGQAEYEDIADAIHFACRDLRKGRRTSLSLWRAASASVRGAFPAYRVAVCSVPGEP